MDTLRRVFVRKGEIAMEFYSPKVTVTMVRDLAGSGSEEALAACGVFGLACTETNFCQALGDFENQLNAAEGLTLEGVQAIAEVCARGCVSGVFADVWGKAHVSIVQAEPKEVDGGGESDDQFQRGVDNLRERVMRAYKKRSEEGG